MAFGFTHQRLQAIFDLLLPTREDTLARPAGACTRPQDWEQNAGKPLATVRADGGGVDRKFAGGR
jgi:hypothetical protein